MNKCQHRNGVTISLFGQDLDPCNYQETERHENVNINVLRCRLCGNVDIEWERTPETVSYIYRKEKE